MDDEKQTIRAWFGLAEPFDWRKRSYLGPLLFGIGVLIVGGLFSLAIAAAFKLLGAMVLPGLFGRGTPPTSESGTTGLGLSAVIVAMIGAPFVVWRAVVAQKQVNVAEQGQITDRISKAVEGLGAEKTVKDAGGESTKPNLEVRIGAIYALERIAQDSLRDHIQIMETLCAYIRENAPCDEIAPKVIPVMRAIIRSDIQTALTVLGRRTSEGKDKEAKRRFRLDLRSVDLSGASFENGDFTATDFRASKLEGSIFNFSTIKGCKMQSANLRYACFQDADLTGSRLDHATISPSDKFNSINRSNLNGVSLFGASMEGIYMKTAFKKYLTIGSKDEKFGGYDSAELAVFFEKLNEIKFSNEAEDIQARVGLEVGGLNFWSPFSKNDLANGQILQEARAYLGLTAWPYNLD